MNKPIYGTQPTRYIITNLNIHDDDSMQGLFVLFHLNDSLLERIVKLQEGIRTTGEELDIYHIVIWDNIGNYIPSSVVSAFDFETGEPVHDDGYSYISETTFNRILEISKTHESVRTESTTIEVHDTFIRFNGSIRYGSTFGSDDISLSLM